MAISFEIVHTYEYIQLLTPIQYSVDSLKCFVNHTCSLTTMILLVFHVLQLYLVFENAYEAFNAIDNHFTLDYHICFSHL